MLLLLLAACPDPGGIDLLPGGDTAAVDTGDSPEPIGDTGDTAEPDEVPDEPEPDHVVDCAGGGDFTSITAAIDAAHSGERIGLRACTYTENLDYRGKTLDIYGLAPRSQVVIVAAARGPVVTAVRGESVGTRLAHVTLSGGANGYGAALYVDRALFTLQDAVVTGNGSSNTGSTHYQSAASVRFIDVELHDNEVSGRQGMEVYANDGSLHLQRVTMRCAGAPYGIYQHVCLLMTDSTLDCAEADYGVVVSGGELHVRRSRIDAGSVGVYAEDNADTRNERVWLYNTAVVARDYAVNTQYMHVKVRNSVLLGDRALSLNRPHADSYLYSSAFVGDRCAVDDDASPYVAAYNAIGDSPDCGFAGTDTITGDPGFVDAPGDLHLAAGSPLVDAGDPDPGENDADGTRNDIGIYGGNEGDGPR